MVFPSTWATPRPSRSRDSMRAVGMPRGASVPAADELAPVLLARLGERFTNQPELARVPLLVALAADQLKALKQEIGVRSVGRAVVPDALDSPGLVLLPHLRAVHAQ